jgi:hypothetical protein
MEQNTQLQPQGKGLGVAGFVISLIALVGWLFVGLGALAKAALDGVQGKDGGGMGLMIGWLILSVLGTVLSMMGMMKLGKTGGKKGLAITGMVLGIVATLLSAWVCYGLSKVGTVVSEHRTEIQKSINDVSDSLKKAEQH